MTKIIKRLLLISTITIFFNFPCFSEETFSPWNSDVRIGDERIEMNSPANEKVQIIFNSPKAGAFFMIRAFQKFISPQDGPNCRFHPTCSRYGKVAVLRYGAFIGALLAGDRIIRCNPFTPPGEDPVPDTLFY